MSSTLLPARVAPFFRAVVTEEGTWRELPYTEEVREQEREGVRVDVVRNEGGWWEGGSEGGYCGGEGGCWSG